MKDIVYLNSNFLNLPENIRQWRARFLLWLFLQEVFLSPLLPTIPQKTGPAMGRALELIYPILDILLKCRQMEDVLNVNVYIWAA